MNDKQHRDVCNFCGGSTFVARKMDYLYSHAGKYLIVPDMPVETCLTCGMVYFEAGVLKEVERRFFAIYSNREKPDRLLTVPATVYA